MTKTSVTSFPNKTYPVSSSTTPIFVQDSKLRLPPTYSSIPHILNEPLTTPMVGPSDSSSYWQLSSLFHYTFHLISLSPSATSVLQVFTSLPDLDKYLQMSSRKVLTNLDPYWVYRKSSTYLFVWHLIDLLSYDESFFLLFDNYVRCWVYLQVP